MSFYCSADLTVEQALLNRGLFFGESPFTTMLSSDGNFLFLSDHLERLSQSYRFLYESDDWEVRKKEILKGLESLKEERGLFSYRITFFQLIESNVIHFLIYRKPVQKTCDESLSLTLAKGRRASGVLPVYFKHGNYCEINIELREAKRHGFDDVLFLDENGYLKECSTSNIFIRKSSKVFTPKLAEGLLGGITRFNLLRCLQEKGIETSEEDITLEELYKADEVWVTSAIKGVRRVNCVDDRHYESNDSWDREIMQTFKDFCGLK